MKACRAGIDRLCNTYFALSGLAPFSMDWTRGDALRACPWLLYSAPLALFGESHSRRSTHNSPNATRCSLFSHRALNSLAVTRAARALGISRIALFPNLARHQGTLQADCARGHLGHHSTPVHDACLQPVLRQTGRRTIRWSSLSCLQFLCTAAMATLRA